VRRRRDFLRTRQLSGKAFGMVDEDRKAGRADMRHNTFEVKREQRDVVF